MFMRRYLVSEERKSNGLSESITNPRCRSQSLIPRTNTYQEAQRAGRIAPPHTEGCLAQHQRWPHGAGRPHLRISAIETILSDTIVEKNKGEDQMAVMPPQEFSLPLLSHR
jgi:hypothetical protein